jgi:methanethiol S-methyltransferase
MKRISIFLFGSISYILFFGTFLYWIGFTINYLVPKGIDGGEETSVVMALLINTALILLFGLQHSIMARQGFKEFLTKMLPKSAERSVYVLASSLIFLFIFWQWRPIPITLWTVENEIAQIFIYALFALGWIILLLSTFLINHFELFGLQQIYKNLKNHEMNTQNFRMPLFYKLVRHPMMIGVIIALWATPVMTLGHLWFAFLMTLYIIIGLQFEERDLIKTFGEKYLEYQKRVPALIPFSKRRIKTKEKELSLT